MKKAALALILIIACIFVFASCDTKDDVTYYQENVVGKYGDGISLIGTVTPDTEPVYYADLPRVEKSIYFDTRLEGWHFTGIYVVKGEKITVTIPEEKADGTIQATVGRYSSGSYSVKLDGASVTFESTVSGLLDVNLGKCYGDDFWSMTVSGGIAASYYRLGLDRMADWEDSVDYAVVDGANVRLYLPASYLDSSEDVENAAAWWRSVCDYLDVYTLGEFGVDKLTPTEIFFVNYASDLYYNQAKDALYVPVSYAECALDAEKLSQGAAWDIMLELAKSKVEGAIRDKNAAEVSQILAAGAFVKFTDGILSQDCGDEYWINNPADCLEKSLAGELTGYGNLAAYVNLMHSFGEENVIPAVISYVYGKDDAEAGTGSVTLAQHVCNAFAEKGTDLAPYFSEFFGLNVTNAQSGLEEYVPVSNRYALGYLTTDKTGVTVNSGEKTAFDFAGATVSSGDAKLVRVLLGEREWKAGEDGLYEYKPGDDVKRSDFTLIYDVNGQQVSLGGRFTCNIAVSVFRRYEDVPWRDMKSAVKEYSGSGASYIVGEKAVSKAEIPQNSEVDDSVYTFSVNNGVIQVKETATYVIYVRSKGMTRVDFGVPEYTFTMFENTLTVNEYTDLLCYEIELQQGVSYYYDIYILATKGNAYACLGICKKGEKEIKDIDDSYLVYYPFDRDEIESYVAPAIVPDSFSVVREGRKDYELIDVTVEEYPQPAAGSEVSALTDGSDSTSFVSKEGTEHVFVLAYAETLPVEYVTVKTSMTGVKYKLEYGVDGIAYTVFAEGTLNGNLDSPFEKKTDVKYLRLTLYSDVAFSATVKDIVCGVYAGEATIVPSNSSRVLYQGKWQYKTGGISVNGWILESYGDDAAIEFNFYGTGISAYCAKGDVYGSMQVYVDGKQYGVIDLNSSETLYDCNVFSVTFDSPGKHKIRIVPSSNDDIINLDYFSVVYAEQQEAAPEVGNLWYFAIIPAAILVIFTICVVLDVVDKRNKKRRTAAKSGQLSE